MRQKSNDHSAPQFFPKNANLSTSDSAFVANSVAKTDLANVNQATDSASPKTSAKTSTSKAPRHSLRDILSTSSFHCGNDVEFVSVAESSRVAMPGDLVVYRIGQEDPQRIVADALSRGAAGILTEQLLPCPLPQCIVADIDLAMAKVTTTVLDRPHEKLLTIGVVGSAGKTTTALLISTLFAARQIRTAFQTGLGCSDGVVESTPESRPPVSSQLVNWIAESVDCESQVAIIELDQRDLRHGRYDCIGFDLLVVTGSGTSSNQSGQDDFGPTSLSCALDNLNTNGVVIAPADDAKSMQLIKESGLRYVSYGVRGEADVTAKIIDQSCGVSTLLVTYDDSTAVMETPLCGGAMAANQAAAATVGLLADFELPEIVKHLGCLRKVPGRGQIISSYGHASVIVDVAGCPDRCAAAMRAARSMKTGGKLWCIAAINGADDATSQARLGNLMERFADQAIITSVAGQKQSFLSASHQVLDGVENLAAMRLVASQQRAIQWAMSEAKPQDTILVMTNQSAKSAHEDRCRIVAIEQLVQQHRDQEDIARPKPTLKVFG